MRSLLKYGSVALAVCLLVGERAGGEPLANSDDELNPTSWSGFVIAPYFGYETLNLNGAGSAGLGDLKGWRVGGELDYDYQIGNFVVGIAGDAFYTWYDSNGSGPQNGINSASQTMRPCARGSATRSAAGCSLARAAWPSASRNQERA